MVNDVTRESSTGPAESKTLCMHGRFMLENREIGEVCGQRKLAGAVGEGL